MEVVLAVLPLLVALVVLVLLQRGARQAGLATLATAIGLALSAPVFRLSTGQVVLALGDGVAASLLVLSVLLPGLLLFRLQQVSGGMDVLAQGMTRLSPDRNLAIVLLVLGLAPFIESISGFGVAIVVVVPIFRALGFAPWPAALLGTLGQVAIPWGALAVGTLLGAELTGLDAGVLGARTALLTGLLPASYACVALYVGAGVVGLRQWWPVALLGGLVLSLSAGLFSLALGVELAGVLASALTLVMLAAWGRLRRHAPDTSSPAIPQFGAATGPQPHLWQALAPYLLLSLLLLLTRLVAPLRLWLQTHATVVEPAINLRLLLLYMPGTWLLLAILLSLPLLRLDAAKIRLAATAAWQQFVPGAIAIISFLAAAQVMRAAGMTAALGGAAASLGAGYLWLAPWLGALGGWLTGSNAGSNAMFALLQMEAAHQASLPQEWVLAAQNSAASHATMVSPARLILAAAAAGLPGSEGRLLRTIGPVVLAAVALITVLVWLASQ